MTTLLKNCHLISPDVDMEGAALLIENGSIKEVFAAGTSLPDAENTVDAENMMVMPGFFDVHCHGRSGMDFCDGSFEAIETIALGKLKEGVTSFLPTTLTLPESELAAALKTAAEYVAKGSVGCRVPGVHLEGPFINPSCIGAQNPAYIRKPDIKEVMRLNEIFPVKKVSFAIEMEGAVELTADLIAAGITPSCVHSAAKYKQFLEGYNAGLRNLSHFCNQMTPLHHRDIGLVGAGLMHKDVYIEFICDKLHIDPAMIKLVFDIKGTDHIQFITDAMRASGLPDGESSLGGLPVTVKNGEARLTSSGALAGSTLQFNHALRNVYEITGLPLKELVKCTSWNQAQALGIAHSGKLAAGFDADIVILDDKFNVRKVFIAGVEKPY